MPVFGVRPSGLPSSTTVEGGEETRLSVPFAMASIDDAPGAGLGSGSGDGDMQSFTNVAEQTSIASMV
jgi:hypothetical protein